MGHTTYNEENEEPDNSRFKGISYLKKLKASVSDHMCKSLGGQLSGHEVATIVESFIRSNDEKKCTGSPRDTAVKVSFMMLQEGFIRPISGIDTSFNEDRRTFYRLGNPDEVQSVSILKSRDSSCEREKPERRARKGSLSRILQSPLIRRASLSRGSSKLSIDSSSSSTCSSRRSEEDETKLNDEARLYEFALSRLLTLVDIPQIEELVEMQSHCGDELKDGSTINLLTSILSRMGLWTEEEEGADPATFFVLMKNRRAKMVSNYFKSAAAMCPRMQIQEDRSLDEYDQVEMWGRQALKSVLNRLDSITQNGNSPLIPKEFSKLVSATSVLPKDKISEAVIYLCGMIPFKLRKELLLVIGFLSHCKSSDLIFRLCDVRNCRLDATTDLGENLSHAIGCLRTFIVPHIGDIEQESLIILTLIDNLGELERKMNDMKEESLRSCSPVPARFCEAVEEAESATDRELANMIKLILNDNRRSQTDKYRQLQLMQTQHPRAYAIYNKNLV